MQEAANWPAEIVDQYRSGQRWDTDFTQEWSAYAWNGGVPRGIDLFSGYDPFGPYRFFTFASHMEGRHANAYPYQPTQRSTLLRVAGVTHTLQAPIIKMPQTTFGAPRIIWQNNHWALWEHQGNWPRVYLSTNLIERSEKKEQNSENQLEALERLAGGNFYEQRQPVVIAHGDFKVAATKAAPGHVIKWQRRLNRFVVDLETSSSSVLVIGDTFYPGWRAYEEGGKELRIAPANYLFRGVAVPKGARRVTLVYEPQTVRFAFFISLCGLAGLCFLAMQAATRGNRISQKPS
jgi:hypothetical protein